MRENLLTLNSLSCLWYFCFCLFICLLVFVNCIGQASKLLKLGVSDLTNFPLARNLQPGHLATHSIVSNTISPLPLIR